MPIYEYVCQACGQQFDKLFLSLSRVPKEMACPACNSMEVQRLVSAPAGRRGASSSDGGEVTAEPATGQTPVIGRKEIQAAQEKKRQLREQAKYGD
ncbi:MAG TPA: zinc ribbon domain-containing protein [Anaerolineae bacterium]|nr:zinc ribbon domain-containing protein [Anaerolineae bacterium]HMR66994.1 zinc ribbon domain-containing protein [Anaerolineae bacterium]